MHHAYAQPSWEVCRSMAGRQVTVHDDHDREVARLWLEVVTAPVVWRDEVAFSVLFTGPASHPLAAGRYRVHRGPADLRLSLEPVIADARYAYYEAYVVLAAPSPAHLAA